MTTVRFVREFFKYPRQIGTFTESSKALARKMAQEIDGSSTVVEFGAGTGSVTRQILQRLPADGRLICFEINASFCEHLRRIGDPRLMVINDDAANCRRHIDAPECVVSALPLALLKKSKKNHILSITGKCKRYVQLQYTPLLRGKMREYFREVTVKFVPQNFPPAFVFVCKNPRG